MLELILISFTVLAVAVLIVGAGLSFKRIERTLKHERLAGRAVPQQGHAVAR